VNVLILDNYDSFTWNLVQAVESFGASCTVVRSDRMSLDEVVAFKPERIILSPGPFGPEQTGVCPEVVAKLSGTVAILGVCLGMQVIATVAGARVCPSGRPVHGKAHCIFHDGAGILHSIPSPFRAARYHSLHVDTASVLSNRRQDRRDYAQLEVTARTEDGVIMGCRIAGTATEGVLFHPESFLTEHGRELIGNFLKARADVG
jgi:anthranilate synthase/aminodeoxychorismate synthase-like glutamine amidotransferase